MPDIDIDFANRDEILKVVKHRIATLDTKAKHNTGVYVTEIPHDPLTLKSTIGYKEAEDRGYFKLDFLNVSLYKHVRDLTHLSELQERKPLWELLGHKEFTDGLFHIAGHHELCQKLQPQSVIQLAAVLAIIRPGKRYLADKSWPEIHAEVWKKPEDGSYYFKKSHAVSYAVAVIVHMNLLVEILANE